MLVNSLASIFPVLFVVLIIRSFFIEPYKIPSGSMIPTLMIGDFILVDKNIYGYKFPLTNITLIENENPKRGDVVVFKYPENKALIISKELLVYLVIKYYTKIKDCTLMTEYPLIKIEHSFDPIEIADGEVFIENNLQKEYMILNQSNPPFNFEYTVPDGTYFV